MSNVVPIGTAIEREYQKARLEYQKNPSVQNWCRIVNLYRDMEAKVNASQ